jgi:hypothetical protein
MIKKTNWFKRMLHDHDGEPSSKRVIGVLSALSLIYCLILNALYPLNKPAEYLVDAIALLTFGCLGLTSTEKIFSIIKSNKNNITKKEETKKEEKPKVTDTTSNGNVNADTDGDNGSEVK